MAEPASETPTDQQLIEQDPGLLATDPELLARYDEEIAARFAAQEPEPPEPPTPPPSPPEPAAAAASSVEPPSPAIEEPKGGPPAYLDDISDEDREKVLADWYNRLPEDKRRNFPPLQQMIRDAETAAETRGEQRGRQSVETEDLTSKLGAAEQKLLDDPTAQTAKAYHDLAYSHGFTTAGTEMTAGFDRVLAELKIGGLPNEVVRAVKAAPGLPDQIHVLGRWLANVAYEAGQETVKRSGTVVSEAEQIVMKSRLRHEAIAQAAKDGKLRIAKDDEGFYAEFIKDNTPPVLSGVASAPTGSGYDAAAYARDLQAGIQPTEEQIDAMTRQYAAGG